MWFHKLLKKFRDLLPHSGEFDGFFEGGTPQFDSLSVTARLPAFFVRRIREGCFKYEKSWSCEEQWKDHQFDLPQSSKLFFVVASKLNFNALFFLTYFLPPVHSSRVKNLGELHQSHRQKKHPTRCRFRSWYQWWWGVCRCLCSSNCLQHRERPETKKEQKFFQLRDPNPAYLLVEENHTGMSYNFKTKWHVFTRMVIIEGNLEVKLPTIWEMKSRAEK